MTNNPRTPNDIKWPLVVFATFLISVLIWLVANPSSKSWPEPLSEDWSQVTIEANNAAFGDGASIANVSEGAIYAVGEQALLGDLQITVTSIEPANTVAGNIQAWQIGYLVKNLSSADEVYVHPRVDAQVQYVANDFMVSKRPKEVTCAPAVTVVLENGLGPGNSFECTALYELSERLDEFYWVFFLLKAGINSYETDYVIFGLPQ